MHRRAILVLAVTLSALAAIEMGIRLFDVVRGASPHARTVWYWGYKQDRFLGFRARPNVDIVMAGGRNRVDTNSEGFRDRDFGSIDLTAKRLILCVGESSTWGTGSTSRETTWPRVLEGLLARADPDFVVLNAGIPGYTIVENVQLINLRLLKYEPEVILYMGFRNDVVFYATSLSSEVDLNFYPRQLAVIPSSWFEELAMRSSLVGLIVGRMSSVLKLDSQGLNIPQNGRQLTSRGIETMRDGIAMIHTLTARHKVKLMWIDQPIDYASIENPALFKEARAILQTELHAHGVPLLAAHDSYPFASEPMLDDVHFTDAGNQKLAEIVAPQVLEQLGVASASR